MKEIEEHNGRTPVRILVGNKSDLINHNEVDVSKAQEFANTNNMDFFEISAKNGTNVNECFMHTTKRIINEYDPYSIDSTPNISNSEHKCHCIVL